MWNVPGELVGIVALIDHCEIDENESSSIGS